MQTKDFVIVATSGSVDDGKSTLIGRLLYDCDSIYQDVLKTLKKDYESEDVVIDNLACLTDGLEAEREQGITIDVAYKHFSRPNRKFLLADVPGHEQYTRNMITGVSRAEAVVIMIDATLGVSIQSKRHFFVAATMGVKNIFFAINKMDIVGYSEDVFIKIKSELEVYANKLKVFDSFYIPMSAKFGDMVVNRGENMKWYKGDTLLKILETFPIKSNVSSNFRLPIQCVLNEGRFRGYAGLVESGVLQKGEEITIIPSNKVTKVKDIYIGFDKVDKCVEKQSVLISIDNQLDISRGDMIIDIKNPIIQSDNVSATLFWFDEKILKEGQSVILKNNTKEVRGVISKIEYVVNMETALKNTEINSLKQNDVGKVLIELKSEIFFDYYSDNRNTGSFILIDDITYDTIGAGLIVKNNEN